MAPRQDLDSEGCRRTRELTDLLVNVFDPGILWDEYGIIADVVVCTCGGAFKLYLVIIMLLALYQLLPLCRYPRDLGPRPPSPNYQRQLQG
jgi:hypothetical protein